MLMLTHIEKVEAKTGKKASAVGWDEKGLAFFIRDKDTLVNHWLPLFFRQSKFSSFTRKLYRWGFRQVSVSGEPMTKTASQEMFFCNENFQRNRKSLMSNMRSVTAAGRRREQQAAEEDRKIQQLGLQAPFLSPELQQLLRNRAGTSQTIGVPNSLSVLAAHARLLGLQGLPIDNSVLQQVNAINQLQQQSVFPAVTQQEQAARSTILSLPGIHGQAVVHPGQQGQLQFPSDTLVRSFTQLQQAQQGSGNTAEEERLKLIVNLLSGNRANLQGSPSVTQPPR